MDNLTPRGYAAARRNVPFGGYGLHPGHPEWVKAGGGYIAVCDGSDRRYVAPGMIFSVEITDGTPRTYSYHVIGKVRPYTLSTIKHFAKTGQLVRDAEPLNFREMIQRVHNVYPTAGLPDAIAWYGEHGLWYDEDTGTVLNPLNLS